MTAIDAIRLHLDNLRHVSTTTSKSTLTNFAHGLSNSFAETNMFSGLLAAPLLLLLFFELASGNPNMKLVEVLGGFAGTLATAWTAAFAAMKVSSMKATPHAHQWNAIMKQAEVILQYNSNHAEMVDAVTGLINDGRVTYKWADMMITLMERWVAEEQANQHQTKQLERLNVLKRKQTILEVEGEEMLVLEPTTTPLHISL